MSEGFRPDGTGRWIYWESVTYAVVVTPRDNRAFVALYVEGDGVDNINKAVERQQIEEYVHGHIAHVRRLSQMHRSYVSAGWEYVQT